MILDKLALEVRVGLDDDLQAAFNKAFTPIDQQLIMGAQVIRLLRQIASQHGTAGSVTNPDGVVQ